MLRILTVFLAVVGLGWSLGASASEVGVPYAAGTHYRVLDNPVAVDKPGKIEVREFFFWGCPHCYHAEPMVEEWLKHKPKDVNFVRTPVLFLQGGEPLARAFYVAQDLGILDKVMDPVFDAIHKYREPLFSEPALANFFRKYDVKPKKFDELYTSFGVSTKVRQAQALTRDYKIQGVPSFAVNGKYVVLRQNLKDEHETFKVIDWLVKQERKSSSKNQPASKK